MQPQHQYEKRILLQLSTEVAAQRSWVAIQSEGPLSVCEGASPSAVYLSRHKWPEISQLGVHGPGEGICCPLKSAEITRNVMTCDDVLTQVETVHHPRNAIQI